MLRNHLSVLSNQRSRNLSSHVFFQHPQSHSSGYLLHIPTLECHPQVLCVYYLVETKVKFLLTISRGFVYSHIHTDTDTHGERRGSGGIITTEWLWCTAWELGLFKAWQVILTCIQGKESQCIFGTQILFSV